MSGGAIGLIAGNGRFPHLFARGARRAGLKVVVAALQGEAAADLEGEVDELFWVPMGRLKAIAQGLKKRGVSEAAFAGGVSKLQALHRARPDLAMLRALTRLGDFGDDRLLRSIAQALEELGVRIVPSTLYLKEAMAVAGQLGRVAPSAEQERDIELGRQVAEALGRADVGQTVVVKGGSVIAVEAAEGTDRCIRRAGELCGPGLVVVKRAKPKQDERFDLPAVGPTTIESIAAARGAVLAVEAGRTVLLEAGELVRRADQAGIAVVAG